jgi:uncharacterized membrane protein YeiH
MTWEVFSIFGTIAFAVSGAIIAMEEKYDILGVYILGIVTAFGGGAIRNLLIGIPVSDIWNQGTLFGFALFSITVVFLFPHKLLKQWQKCGNFFDAIGLAAFAIQGALYASQMHHSLSTVIVAAVLTGSGGGIIRDVLAGRKPIIFRSEIYAVWAILAGVIIGLDKMKSAPELYILFSIIVVLRVCSYMYNWKLPNRSIKVNHEL